MHGPLAPADAGHALPRTSFARRGAVRRLLAPLLALGALGPLACDDSLAPFEPEIGNATDSFQFQVTDLRDVTTTRDYEWQQTGAVANVDHSTSLTGGGATLVIRDAGGTEVYRRDLTTDGTFVTAAGAPGRWRIRVELQRATGTVNFRVQRRTP